MAYDQNAAARLRALLQKGGATSDRTCPKGMHRAYVGTRSETCVPDTAPAPVLTGESWFARFIGSLGQPASAVPSLYPLLKAPTPEARQALRQHLSMAARVRRGAPVAPQPARKRVAQPKPPMATPGWTPNAPGGPATTMPAPAAPAAPAQEIDVTPTAPAVEEPRYDGFHGHAPSFSGPQEEFGDLEADLGLAD